jgi:uncharacterized membrane protein
MASQPPTSDGPFGLQPNLASGLGYLFGVVGGIIMLVGGGTNRLVKWNAAQSITIYIAAIVGFIIAFIIGIIPHLGFLAAIIFFVVYIYTGISWLWGTIGGFMGKEVRLPVTAGITDKLFGSVVG